MAGTVLYSFTSASRILASQLNKNFDWVEGSYIPMNGGYKTNAVYNLGETNYRFLNTYIKNINLYTDGTIYFYEDGFSNHYTRIHCNSDSLYFDYYTATGGTKDYMYFDKRGVHLKNNLELLTRPLWLDYDSGTTYIQHHNTDTSLIFHIHGNTTKILENTTTQGITLNMDLSRITGDDSSDETAMTMTKNYIAGGFDGHLTLQLPCFNGFNTLTFDYLKYRLTNLSGAASGVFYCYFYKMHEGSTTLLCTPLAMTFIGNNEISRSLSSTMIIANDEAIICDFHFQKGSDATPALHQIYLTGKRHLQ